MNMNYIYVVDIASCVKSLDMQTSSLSSFLSFAMQYIQTDVAPSYIYHLATDEPMGFNVEYISTVKDVNLIEQKKLHKLIDKKIDHKHINILPAFKNQSPTFERLAIYIYELSFAEMNDHLESIQLKIPDLANIFVDNNKKVKVTYFNKINCVHRHHNPDLSMDENKELYGKCSGLHGHEYKIEFSLEGDLNNNGEVHSWVQVHKLIDEQLINKYNQTYLNEKMGNTSGELIIKLFYEKLKNQFPDRLTTSLVLRETLKNSFYIK